MPTFKITGPDGKSYRVTGDNPEGALSALQQHLGSSAPQKEPEFAGGMAGAAALGAGDTLSFGFGDEIGAGLGAASEYLASKVTGEKPRSYDELLTAMRDQEKRAKEENPGSFLAGQIAGGVAGGVGLAKGGLSLAANAAERGAGLARVSGASLIDGAGVGALQGFGSGEGIEDRVGQSAKGLALGGVVGGLAPGAVAGASKVAKGAVAPFVAPFMPEPYAQDAVTLALQRSGKTPEQIARIMSYAAEEGQPMYNVADALGHTGQRLMSTVARNPHNERQAVVEALQRRQAGQGERLASFVEEAFEAPQTAAAAKEAATKARSVEANELYSAARKASGAVDVGPILAKADETLAPGVNQIVNPRDKIAPDSIEASIARVRGMLSDGNSQVTDFNSLFRVKLEVDDMVARADAQNAGNKAYALSELKREIDKALETASPQFRQANDTFARRSRAIDAIDEGAAATRISKRSDDTIPAFLGKPAEEQAGFRTGYADRLIGRIEGMSSSPTTNKARILQSPKMEQELQAFPNPIHAALLGRRIGREQRMFDTAAAALGGSKTADNLADAADLSKLDPSVMSALMRQDYVGALMNGVSKALNTAKGMPPAVSERVARALMNTNPDDALRLLERGTEKMSKADRMRSAVVAALMNSGAAGAGRL